VPGLADLLPAGERHLARKPRFVERLRACVHPGLYLAQLEPEDVALLGPEPSPDAVLFHYLQAGVQQGLRVCALFHPQWYADRLAERGLTSGDDVPFLHWLTVGWRERIVPTPLFDEEWYIESHPPMQSASRWVFEHYLQAGCYQPRWVPSPFGAHHAGAKAETDDRRDPLMLPELLHRHEEYDLSRTSWLEEGVLAAMRQHERLRTSPALRAMLEHAAEAEPMIGMPKRGGRPVTSALHRNPRLRVLDEVDAAMREIGPEQVDTMILVPHCRMGGAARVAGIFAHAVQAVAPDGQALVVATDDAAFERPDWFPSDVPVLDLTAYTQGMRQPLRQDVLLDLIRQVRPRHVVVINSRLGWKLIGRHGRRLAESVQLGAYLFTWELSRHDFKVGYPIRDFQHCVEHLAWTLFDSETLRQELIGRYLLPAETQRRLVLARTPVDPPGVDVAGVFEERRRAGAPLRAFWAGRFDRQKRFDLVVEVARLRPDIEIWAWGKAVMADLDIDLDDLPPNIRLMGTYTDFAELPLDQVDFMLYTAQWDGIPTLLLDVAQAGLPVVASAVGGVSEVIGEETGYPVHDALSAAAYVEAIDRMLADPAAATARVAAVRRHIAEHFDVEHYQRIVAAGLQLEQPLEGDAG
jgi:glycosyltransferase involved in cell wall biosynthesis